MSGGFNKLYLIPPAAVLLVICTYYAMGGVTRSAEPQEWRVFDDESAVVAEAAPERTRSETAAPAASEPEIPVIKIYITGAVEKPGVYELPADSRVTDAIDAAGGAASEAALEIINLSERIADEEHIIVPKLGEEPPEKSAAEKPQKTPSPNKSPETNNDEFEFTITYVEPVNINTADSEGLQTLSGIGPVTAGRIIDYRETNGGFNKIDDIKKVDRIGEKTFESIKDYITVD